MVTIKFLYILENSLKSLVRTPGISMTALLVFVLGILAFAGFDGYLLLAHWEEAQYAELVAKYGPAGMQLGGPNLIALALFKVMAGVFGLVGILGIVGYLGVAFRQYLLEQRQSLKTMGLLGETSNWLGLGAGIEASLLALVTLIFSGLVADWLFYHVLAETASRQTFGKSFLGMLWGTTKNHSLAIVVACLLIGLRTFFNGRKIVLDERPEIQSAEQFDEENQALDEF